METSMKRNNYQVADLEKFIRDRTVHTGEAVT